MAQRLRKSASFFIIWIKKSAKAPCKPRVGQNATSMWRFDRHDSHRVSLRYWRARLESKCLPLSTAGPNDARGWRGCLDINKRAFDFASNALLFIIMLLNGLPLFVMFQQVVLRLSAYSLHLQYRTLSPVPSQRLFLQLL